jgi:ubiquinone/menaquinone biosynthesis C-methylase UbiE/uncharacterized protein YbaR (Trm112 family)
MTLLGGQPNLTVNDLRVLVCPVCRSGLRFDGGVGHQRADETRAVEHGALICRECARVWSLVYGIPHMVEPGSVKGLDWFLRPIYDVIAPWHDLGVNFVLPVLQYPDPGASRERYIERLDLARLEPAEPGAVVRVLEVGVGAGANLPLLRRELPMDLDVEIWGLDLSPGMLLQCRWRAKWLYNSLHVRLVLGDAHHLPFADATFDRVFHVGGINGYRDVRRGLAEMARVARPGTPIVVVDEELDPDRKHSLHHRIAFDSLTWFDPDPRAPCDLLPPEATDVEVTRVSRFYYCLTFKKTALPAPAGTSRYGG